MDPTLPSKHSLYPTPTLSCFMSVFFLMLRITKPLTIPKPPQPCPTPYNVLHPSPTKSFILSLIQSLTLGWL